MKLSRIKIQKVMSERGIESFTQLAEILNISKNQVSVMLSENFNPIKSSVQKLADILQVPVEKLIEDFFLEHSPIKDVKKNKVKGIELFAGAGGLALGLEMAGIEDLAFVEIDKICCHTLKENRPYWNVINQDIHNVDFSQYSGKVEVVSGGFPCQAFSYAGKKLGFEDTRGTLFYEYARCVKEVRPHIFLAENVKGLVSHDQGRTFETIMNVFSSLGYHVQYKILNACYFGVPQKRERVVIIGIRNDLRKSVKFHFPSPSDHSTTLREGLKDCPKSIGQQYSIKKKKVLDLVPPGGCWVDLPDEIAKEYLGKSYYSGGGRRGMARRISWDEPCLTLTCSPSQKQTERCHPDETRPFTVREYARIQSFPDSWEFSGSIGAQYKQIGNAVPVKLAECIGKQIVSALSNAHPNS